MFWSLIVLSTMYYPKSKGRNFQKGNEPSYIYFLLLYFTSCISISLWFHYFLDYRLLASKKYYTSISAARIVPKNTFLIILPNKITSTNAWRYKTYQKKIFSLLHLWKHLSKQQMRLSNWIIHHIQYRKQGFSGSRANLNIKLTAILGLDLVRYTTDG